MASTLNSDNGVVSGSAGLKSSADSSGVLALQTNGTTAVTIDTAQRVFMNSSAVPTGVTGTGVSLWNKQSNTSLNAINTVASASDAFTYIGTNATVGAIGVSYGSTAGYLPLAFYTSDAEKMRLDASGNLLVGASSGGQGRIASLIGSSSTQAFDASFSGAGGTGIGYQSRYTNTTGTAYHAYFVYNGSAVGSIQSSSTLTSYLVSSDYRLKENIAPLTGGLDTIFQLKPSVYNYKSDPETQVQGFIAHELQAVVPHAVSGEKDAVDANGNPVYQGVDVSFLVPHLVKAIQEQQAIIETLTNRVQALEGAK